MFFITPPRRPAQPVTWGELVGSGSKARPNAPATRILEMRTAVYGRPVAAAATKRGRVQHPRSPSRSPGPTCNRALRPRTRSRAPARRLGVLRPILGEFQQSPTRPAAFLFSTTIPPAFAATRASARSARIAGGVPGSPTPPSPPAERTGTGRCARQARSGACARWLRGSARSSDSGPAPRVQELPRARSGVQPRTSGYMTSSSSTTWSECWFESQPRGSPAALSALSGPARSRARTAWGPGRARGRSPPPGVPAGPAAWTACG